MRRVLSKVLLKAIAPYTRVKLPYLASELNGIPLVDVEDLLVSLILDGKVDGKIDQVMSGSCVLDYEGCVAVGSKDSLLGFGGLGCARILFCTNT